MNEAAVASHSCAADLHSAFYHPANVEGAKRFLMMRVLNAEVSDTTGDE